MVMTYRSGNADSGFEHNGVEAITFDENGIKALSQPLPESAGGSGQATFLAASKSALNASGSAPIYACRAWVNFDGTGTPAIRGSGNVSSITDVGTGKFTVNLTTAMQDTNFCVSASVNKQDAIDDNNGTITVGAASRVITTTTIPVTTGVPSGPADCNYVFVAVFR